MEAAIPRGERARELVIRVRPALRQSHWLAFWAVLCFSALAGLTMLIEVQYSPYSGWRRLRFDRFLGTVGFAVAFGLGPAFVLRTMWKSLDNGPSWPWIGWGAGAGATVLGFFAVVENMPRLATRWDTVLLCLGVGAALGSILGIIAEAARHVRGRRSELLAPRLRRARARRARQPADRAGEAGLSALDVLTSCVYGSSLALAATIFTLGLNRGDVTWLFANLVPFELGRIHARFMLVGSFLCCCVVGFLAYAARQPPARRLSGRHRVMLPVIGYFAGFVGLPLGLALLLGR